MSGTFDALPDALIHEILEKSDEVTILSVQVTCKRYLRLGRAATLWRRKLEHLCGFKLPQAVSTDSTALSRIVRAIFEGSEDPIAFRGVSTDGGVYSDSYWLDNMFRETSCYCTAEDADQGIFCIAALSEPNTPHYLLENRTINFQGESSIVACDHNAVKNLAGRDNEEELVVVRRVVVNRSGFFSCPVASGAISLGHVNWRSLVEQQVSPMDVAIHMHQEMGCGKENKLRGLDSLESVLKACQNGYLQPTAVSWGGNGEWVQFCGQSGVSWPMIWFHFFDDKEYEMRKTNGERARRHQLTCSFQDLGAVCQTVELELQNQCERRTLSSDSRNELNMTLARPAVGSVAFINLISHEQIDERARGEGFFGAGTNIDVRDLKMTGSVIDLRKCSSQKAD